MWVELGRGAYDHSGHSGGGGPDRRTTLMKRAQFGTEQVRRSCMMGSCTLDLPRIHHHIGLKKCQNSSDCCLLALAQKQKRTEPLPWVEKVSIWRRAHPKQPRLPFLSLFHSDPLCIHPSFDDRICICMLAPAGRGRVWEERSKVKGKEENRDTSSRPNRPGRSKRADSCRLIAV